jgi:hypothetical protein
MSTDLVHTSHTVASDNQSTIDNSDFVEWRDVYFQEVAPFLSKFESKLAFAEFIQSLDTEQQNGDNAKQFRVHIGPIMAEFETVTDFFEAVVEAENSSPSRQGAHCSWADVQVATLDTLSTKYMANPEWMPCANAALALPTDIDQSKKAPEDSAAPPRSTCAKTSSNSCTRSRLSPRRGTICSCVV